MKKEVAMYWGGCALMIGSIPFHGALSWSVWALGLGLMLMGRVQ